MSGTIGPRFFRHEHGRLVALLLRRVGTRHLERVEDAVQSALLAAVEAWGAGGVPENPSAWLFQVAQNHFVGELRQRARREALLDARGDELAPDDHGTEPTSLVLAGDVPDSLLQMLFVCCDPEIPPESQLALALKTLCGFDVREIAERLFTTEANVYKRLARARSRLAETPLLREDVTSAQLSARLPAVQAILYALFTGGYLSTHARHAIRRELCDEALRLAEVLAAHPVGATPETFALLALMHLQLARMSAREDATGGLLLLEEQDRASFDQGEIARGLAWLARSADGNVFSRYHAEAGVAAEHCLAASFAETRWDRIVECYELLDRLAPSAIHRLNLALALAEYRGPTHGLALLTGLDPPVWLEGSYLWSAALADLHRRCGHSALATHYGDAAIARAPSLAISMALRRRLGRGSTASDG